MSKVLHMLFILLALDCVSQTPTIIIDKDIYGKTIVTETWNWAAQFSSHSIFSEFQENAKSSSPDFPFYNFSFEDLPISSNYKITSLYGIKQLYSDSLIFEMFGDSQSGGPCAPIVSAQINEIRKFNTKDSLLTEILISPSRQPQEKLLYNYKDGNLTRVLRQKFDALENMFNTYETYDWIYDSLNKCIAYIHYEGMPIKNIKDSLIPWENHLIKHSQSKHDEMKSGIGFFEFQEQFVYSICYLEYRGGRIVNTIGLNNGLLSEINIEYTKKGLVSKCESINYNKSRRVMVLFSYLKETGKLLQTKTKIREQFGKSVDRFKSVQKYNYDQEGRLNKNTETI